MSGLLLIQFDDVNDDHIESAHTPNLDDLASISSIYTYHHGEAACSNSRITLQTGLHSRDHLVGGIMQAEDDWYPVISDDVRTLPEIVGLKSAYIGKYHMTSFDNPIHPCSELGYSRFIGTIRNLAPGNYYEYLEYSSDTNSFSTQTQYATSRYCQLALECLNDDYGFVHLALHAAHKPWGKMPPEGTYVSSDIRPALIESADYYLGIVLDTALEMGYRIIVTGDNGGSKGDGGKGTLKEASLKIPLWIHDSPQTEQYIVNQMTDWRSLRMYLDTGYMSHASVLHHDRFHGAGVFDPATYHQSIQTEEYKLIIDPLQGRTLYRLPDEFNAHTDTEIERRLWQLRLR